jgi:hypothetical protein
MFYVVCVMITIVVNIDIGAHDNTLKAKHENSLINSSLNVKLLKKIEKKVELSVRVDNVASVIIQNN